MNARAHAHRIVRAITACLIVAGLALTGCDDATTGPETSTRTVEGTVTDEEGYGKRSAAVEGATVTAVSVDAQGRTEALSGTAETDASGHYELQVDGATESMIVMAEGEDDFQARTLVHARGEGTIGAMPMNAETSAEADVYVEARQDGGSSVTKSDVALYVDEKLAGRIEAGATTTSEVAQSIRARVETQARYVARESDSGEEDAEDARSRRVAAFADLQSDLAASGSAEAESEAITALEQAVLNAHAEAGVSAETSAEARLAAHRAVELRTESAEDSSDAQFTLRKRSRILTSTAVASAIEARFEAQGAAESRIDSLAEARATLIGELETAASAEAMAQAQSQFESTVRSTLAEEIGASSATLESAVSAASSAKSTLDGALSLGASAEVIAEAHATFFGEARSAIESSLSGNADAQFGTEVLVLLVA